MGSTGITSTELERGFHPGKPGTIGVHPCYAGRHRLDGSRVGVAGGVWLLLLYSLSIALFVGLGYRPSSGMLRFWDSLLPGFDGGSSRGIALGFPLAFLYGAGGAWLFAAIYNIAPARVRADTEVS